VTEVKKRYAAIKKFLQVELEARILAATLTTLCIEGLNDEPDEGVLPSALKNASKPDKRKFLNNLAGNIVDTFVQNKEMVAQVFGGGNFKAGENYRWKV
jgi:hypothetical protein